MKNITDDTPIAMLTVGQLKEILSIDKIMGHLTPSRAPDKEVLTVADVARLTGYSISTVYKLTSERKIPFHKPEHKGRKLYFQREEILDWLQSESHPTIEQENIQRIIKKALTMKTETTTTKPAFDPEVPPREGFIFYRTFYEALASMKNRARLHLYDVIMRYALYGEEPTDLNGEQMRTFILIRPQLDANERKRQAKYKKKAIKKNNDEELNEFFTKTEDEENDNLRILNDIQYE